MIKTTTDTHRVEILRPSKQLTLPIGGAYSVVLQICPFCYCVHAFPPEVIKSGKALCYCSAQFTPLGNAKIYMNEVTN